MVQSVEPRPLVWLIESLVPGRDKPRTSKIDTCGFLALYSALIGESEGWLALCQDNVTQWGIG